jgi:DNA repair protein RecN (Recombination protein N)
MYDIDEIESRLDLIFRYKTKYHVSHLHELVSKISELKNREAALSELIDSSDSLKAKLSEYRQACIGYAEAIHLRRTDAATMLAKHLETDCLNLHFSYCKLNFNCTFSPDSLNAWGADQFDLNISTNKGIPIGPLKTVASGGELSRLMLAIETYRSHSKRPGTLIFDEIDTGIGGITAHAIGEYLSRISKIQPLICITHLAQIAGLANTHLFIEKFETSHSTSIKARHLNTEEKKCELNRMIGGDLVAINL